MMKGFILGQIVAHEVELLKLQRSPGQYSNAASTNLSLWRSPESMNGESRGLNGLRVNVTSNMAFH